MNKYSFSRLMVPDVGTEGSGPGASTETPGAKGTGFNPWDTTETRSASKVNPPVNKTAPAEPVVAAVEPVKAPVAQAQVPAAPVQGNPAPIVGMTDKQLQDLATTLRQGATPTKQEVRTAQPQMTDADFKKAFNIYEADSDTYEAILGVKPDSPARLAAFNAALQGVSKQSITIAQYLLGQKTTELQNTIKPFQVAEQERQGREQFQIFAQEHKDLAGYQPLLKELVESAQARGMKFNSAADARSYIATKARTLLGIKPGSQAPVSQAASPAAPVRSMSTTSMGGRSGASGGQASAMSTAERLFGGQENT